MKKILFVLITGIIISVYVKDTYAANATVKITSDKQEVDEGDVFEISIDIESEEDIQKVEATIIYDLSMLEFVTSSQAISKDGGTLALDDRSKGGKLRTYIIEFKALKKGITQVDFTSAPVVLGNNMQKVISSYISSYVKINGQDDDVDTLENLKVSPGVLNKKFSSNVYEYNITVDNDVTDLVINAKPNSDSAKITITDDESLKVGTTKVKIVVTAEAGNKKEYIIKVKRLSKDEQKEKDKKERIEQRKKRVVVYEDDKRIYIENDSQYEVLDIIETDEMKIPVGYKKIKLELYGIEISACVSEKNSESDIVLIYAENTETGYEGYYAYDKVEKTLQRYFGDTLSIAGNKSKEVFEKQEYEENVKKLGIIVAVAIVLLIISIIVIIKLASDIKNIKNDNYLI